MSETSAGTQPSMTSASRDSRRSARRVLVCTPFPPRLDARHGGKATAQLLLRLAERNTIALLALRTTEDDHVDEAIADRCDLVQEVTLATRSPFARRLAWTAGLAAGVPPWAVECRSDEYAQKLDRLIEEWQPELVEVHLQAMAQYVETVARRRLPRLLVDYDPPSTWADELGGAARGLRRISSRLEAAAWRRYERATRPLFDAIVVFAERDLDAIGPTADGAIVTRVALAVEVPERPLDPVGSQPPTIVFVGSFGHPPNVDAALWLATDIFPRVVALVPDARLQLVGNAPGDEVRALAGGTLSVHASVPDVTPYLDRAAVVVAPIRMGGSMRMKVLESLAAGKALVASPRAAEGVEELAGKQLLIAADAKEMAEAIASLLLDPAQRQALAQSARCWAESNLGWERGVVAFEELYDTIVGAHERAR
jgi:glycosyltransferase involved in cell wall biosynthesis